jgi:glutamate carboxypeptidase
MPTPPDPVALRAALVRDLPAALVWLREWVSINSFTYHRDGVNTVGQATAAAFAPLGFAAEYVPSTDRRCGNHLFLRKPGRTQATLLCVSHLDTVFSTEEEARQNFRWREEPGRIYGPGVVDIKGGTALLWLQLRALRAAAPELYEHFSWVVALNAAEEVLGDDFAQSALARFGDRAKAALVYESGAYQPDNFNLVVARKGRAQFRVAVTGRGAHAGSRHTDGANAIIELGRLLPVIEALTDPTRERTANIGLVRGGDSLNRVPHEAEAQGELRAYDPAALADAEARILALQGPGTVQAVTDGYRCRIHAEITGRTPGWPENAATRRLFDSYTRAAVRLGAQVTPERRGGLSDGNLLASQLPTLDGLGPSGGNAHASEWSDAVDNTKRPEYLETVSIIPKALLNTLAVVELAE